MGVELQYIANLTQIVSLPIALVALIFQVVVWFKPQAPAIQPLLSRLKPVLPFVLVASTFFWIGTWVATPAASKQTSNFAIPDDVPELQSVRSWKLAVNETFSSNNFRWYVNKWENDDTSGNVYIARRYRSEIETRAGIGAELWAEDINLGENYYVESDVQRMQGNIDSGYGLMFHYNRSDNSSYYYFQIKDDKSILVFVKEGNIVTNLYTSSSEAIKPGEVNRLGILAQGPTYSFFINNTYINTINDPRVKGGKVGFLITVQPAENSIVEADNFRLYVP